uniref:Leucine-rich repeat-containing N-terminal plant-type domain-containing protein n=1 Tax=Cannabis sativa TaxID=3483 RepID=A0A803QA49_CANSA
MVGNMESRSTNSVNYEQGQCIEKEKQALLNFKTALDDPGKNLSSWTNNPNNNSNNQNCCNWRGITCDSQTNHIIKIDFSSVYEININGVINGSSSLVELESLEYLDFSGQKFTQIPKFLGALKNLIHLVLPLSGVIPYELGNLTKLEYLALSSSSDQNKMVVDNFGWLSHLTSLKNFVLANVNFTTSGLESFRVPSSLLSLRVSKSILPKVDTFPFSNSLNFLETLSLTQNSIHPDAITLFLNSSMNLIDLTFQENIINGSFPNSFGHKDYLRNVYMSNNEVGSSKGLLKSLRNLSNLIILDISMNNIGGTIHDLFETLSSTKNSLEVLRLSSNKLKGLILDDPEKTFPSLKYLDLGYNLVEGPFPNRLSQFPNLDELYLNNNNFTGLLPDLSSMFNLKVFNGAHNNFNGTSSDDIAQLYHLVRLDVSWNSFNGEFSLQDCPSLKFLDISYNSVRLKFKSNWVPSFQLSNLMLSSSKLGPKFPHWLQTQFNLSYLDISNDEISGLIPSWFGNITSKLYYLNMSCNLLGGTLPNFPLQSSPFFPSYEPIYVDLSFNKFQGSIPHFLSNATVLYLSNNKFNDCKPFLCQTIDIETLFLDISYNHLIGSLPSDCLKNTHFFVLKLNNNRLFGEIPNSICSSSYSSIETLQLGHNNFSGKFPSTLKNCTQLRVLDLGDNNLEDALPLWIGEALTDLVLLSVKSNQVYGNVPLNLCYLTKIQILDLSQNNLSGSIPSCFENFTSMVEEPIYGSTILVFFRRFPGPFIFFHNIASIVWKGTEYEYRKNLGLLRIIDLSSNKLNGEIPIEVTNLVQLVQLNLSRNELSGNIPKKMGSLSKLESLDLSHNKLSGKIPTSLGEVLMLDYLDLSNNKLSGRISTSTQLQSFNASSYAKNFALCGVPLTSSCPGDETSLQSFSTSNGSENDDKWFNMSSVYMGIGVGFFIGFSGNFMLDNSWRFAYLQFMLILRGWLYKMITLMKGAALMGKKLAWH